MTPRLRILSIGLAISLAYAIYDYVERNSNKKSTVSAPKKTKTRARTAGVSASRYENLKKRWAEKGLINDESGGGDFKAESNFLPIGEQISSLDGWDRNPFVEVYEPQTVSSPRSVDRQEVDLDEETLQKMSELTGAKYFRATNLKSLQKIYHHSIILFDFRKILQYQ